MSRKRITGILRPLVSGIRCVSAPLGELQELLQELLLYSDSHYVFCDYQVHEDFDKKLPGLGKLAACSISVVL